MDVLICPNCWRTNETRAALARLVDVEPCWEDPQGYGSCIWCDADQPPWDKRLDGVRHGPECAWVVAHDVIQRPLPAGHTRKDPA